MSTDTDGAPPSVSPEPEDGPGADPQAVTESGSWVHDEIQRRIASGEARTRGRHSRRDGPVVDPATAATYAPRHSTGQQNGEQPAPAKRRLPAGGWPGIAGRPGGRLDRLDVPVTPVAPPADLPPPAAPESPDVAEPLEEVSPVAATAPSPAQPRSVPAPVGPASVVPASVIPAPVVPAQRGEEEPDDVRVRVVLSERKGVARPVRTVVDIQESSSVGELLRSNLIGSQLAVALRFAVVAGLALGLLPLGFALFPEIGRTVVLGIRLPWLLLGGLVYPFLFLLGRWHSRTAERVEQNFADHVQDN